MTRIHEFVSKHGGPFDTECSVCGRDCFDWSAHCDCFDKHAVADVCAASCGCCMAGHMEPEGRGAATESSGGSDRPMEEVRPMHGEVSSSELGHATPDAEGPPCRDEASPVRERTLEALEAEVARLHTLAALDAQIKADLISERDRHRSQLYEIADLFPYDHSIVDAPCPALAHSVKTAIDNWRAYKDTAQGQITAAFNQGWDRCEEYHKWLATPPRGDISMTSAKPSVGQVVHYVAYGTPGGEYPEGVCRAAIITAVEPQVPVNDNPTLDLHPPPLGTGLEFVSLAVLNPTGLFFNVRVPRHNGEDDGHGKTIRNAGTWHSVYHE